MIRSVTLLIILITLATNSRLFAQNQDFISDIESVDSEFYKSMSSGYDHDYVPLDTLRLPMNFYIITHIDGTGGLSASDQNLAIQNLNNAYKQHLIVFYLNSVTTIASSVIDELTADEFDNEIVGVLGTNSTFNVAFVPWTPITFAGIALTGGKYCAVRNYYATYATSSAFIHEIGHNLGLHHTHGRTGQTIQELVDGSNCETGGDLVCDTQAEPYNDGSGIYGKVNNLCTYFGTQVDPNGQPFNPNVDNYMSYTRYGCANKFTAGQVQRMWNTLYNSHRNILNRKIQLANKSYESNSMLTGQLKYVKYWDMFNQADTIKTVPSGDSILFPIAIPLKVTTASQILNSTSQHYLWNDLKTEFKMSHSIIANNYTTKDQAFFKTINSSLTINTKIDEMVFSGTVLVKDPWFKEVDGSQPCNWKTYTNGFNSSTMPNGGVFGGVDFDPLFPSNPFYKIKASGNQNGLNVYFLNWTSTNSNVYKPDSMETPVKFTSGATITANYKAMLASKTTGWVGNQFASNNGTSSVMYISDGKLWLHRENGTDKKEILVSSSAGSISSYSVTANGNNRYWVLNNGTTTPVCGYELNGATGVATVPALSGLTSSSRIEIVRLNSTTPKLALITKVGTAIYKSIGTLTSGVVSWGSWSSLTVGGSSIQVAGNGNLAYVAWIQGSSIFGYKLKTDGTWSSAKVITSSSSGYFTSMASAADPNGNLYLTLVRANTQTQKKDLGEGAWYINETTMPFTVLSTSGTYGDFTAVSLACEGNKRLASVGVSTYIPYFSYYLWKHNGTEWMQDAPSYSSAAAQKLLHGEVDIRPSETEPVTGLFLMTMNTVNWPPPGANKITTGTEDTPALSISGVELSDTLVYNVNLDPAIVDSIIIDTLGVWSIAVKGSGFVTEIVNDLKLFGSSELIVITTESGTSRTIKFIPNLVKWDVWVVDPSGNKVRMGKENSDEESDSESIKTAVAVYPNPFNPETRINIRLAEPAELKVKVYNVVGQLVADLANGHHEMGDYSFRFDGKSLASGTYFYRVEIGEKVKTGKLQLLK